MRRTKPILKPPKTPDELKAAKLPELRNPPTVSPSGKIDKDAILAKIQRQVSTPQHRIDRALVETKVGLRKEIRMLAGQAFLARIGTVCDIADNRNAPFKTRLDAMRLLAQYGLTERTEVLLPKDEIVRAIARVTARFLDEDQFNAWLDLVVEELEESA